ncbi:MAG: hypothetical protein AABY84_13245 [Candidatus Firestonebacteria bacterium]
MKMKKQSIHLILTGIIFSLMINGCGFSVRETYIRSKRPTALKNYKQGPVSPLTKENIESAIEFGKTNRHKQDVINYAFIFTKNVTSFLGPVRNIYILICTNYFLIADYAAKQTRNYEPIDMDYVNFLANLPVFRIEVAEQVVPVGAGYYPFQFKEKAVLLKNGEKVQEATLNTEYKNINPFSTSHLGGIQTNWQESANEAVRSTIEMANKITESYKNNSNVNLKNIPVPVVKVNNLYEYKDIDLASKYEVVVIHDNEEKRVDIDFASVK